MEIDLAVLTGSGARRDPVGRLHGTIGDPLDVERRLQTREALAVQQAVDDGVGESQMPSEFERRHLLAVHVAGQGTGHRSGILCHTAESVKRQTAPHPTKRRQALGVAKTSEDLEAERRIRGHLRQQMQERGITQTELARRIGRDDGDITRLLSGERGIRSLGLVLRICRTLQITATRLLEEDPPEEFSDENWSDEVP